jgi:hypothetical protein
MPRKAGCLNAPERPLSQLAYVRKESSCGTPRFEYIAGKRPAKFRFLEAASRHWVLSPQSRPCYFGQVVVQKLRLR